MLKAALRDLQWRRRRFVIAAVGTGLVFAMTLVLTGLANGFRVEAERTVDALGVDSFIISSGAGGPFLGSVPFPINEARPVMAMRGVEAAVPLVYGNTSTPDGDSTRNVNVFGAPTDGPGMPKMISGRAPANPEEVAVSNTLGMNVGEEVPLGARKLRIVGLVDDSTALAGQANVFLTVDGAQKLLFGGQPLISSIGVLGTPESIPPGFRSIDHDGAVNDLQRALKNAVQAITLMAILLWVVAGLIVGSLIYLSALERTRDFAVFKAVGVSTTAILGGLMVQAVIVAVLAAILGSVLSLAIGPAFTIKVIVPMQAFVLLPILAVLIGLLASVAGVRRAVTIDPAAAFGGP